MDNDQKKMETVSTDAPPVIDANAVRPEPDRIDRILKKFKVMMWLFALLPLSLFLALLFGVGLILLLILLIYSLICLGCGIKEFIFARKTQQRLSQTLFWPTVIVSLCAIAAMPGGFYSFSLPLVGWYSGYMIRNLDEAMAGYAAKHNGQWPEADKWCDQLIENDENAHNYLKRNGDELGCSISMNIHAQPLGMNMPADMVLLFDSQPGWNQAGGAELIQRGWWEGNRISVLLGNMQIEHVRPHDVPYLRWKVDGNLVKPEIPRVQLYSAVIAGFLIICCFVIIKNRSVIRDYRRQIFIIVILAMGLGALLGGMSLALYRFVHGGNGLGIASGAGAGLVMAVAYVLTMARFVGQVSDARLIWPNAVMFGAIAGLICSSFVHAMLMIYFDERSPMPILAGGGYGLYAGAMIGLIMGKMIESKWRQKTQQINEVLSA